MMEQTESAGQSPVERKELEKREMDVIARKTVLPDSGTSAGQINMYPEEAVREARMNELEGKKSPGSTAGGSDDKKPVTKQTLRSEVVKVEAALEKDVEEYRLKLTPDCGDSSAESPQQAAAGLELLTTVAAELEGDLVVVTACKAATGVRRGRLGAEVDALPGKDNTKARSERCEEAVAPKCTDEYTDAECVVAGLAPQHGQVVQGVQLRGRAADAAGRAAVCAASTAARPAGGEWASEDDSFSSVDGWPTTYLPTPDLFVVAAAARKSRTAVLWLLCSAGVA